METAFEKKVREFVHRLLKAYLEEEDMQKVLKDIDETITWMGMGEHEIGHGIDQVRRILEQKESRGTVGYRIQEEIYYVRQMAPDVAAFLGELELNSQGEEKERYQFRCSGICGETKAGLKIYQFHISEENQELRQKLEHYSGMVEQLEETARRDSLTGLYNKKATEELGEQYVSRAAGEELCGVMIMDLDDFKEVNDTYGHLMGDEVLAKVAKVFRNTFRRQDVIGRIGGDEFIVIMPGISARDKLEEMLKRLHANLLQASEEGNCEFSISTGIAVAPMDGTTFRQLYRKADAVLYTAKKKGKRQVGREPE